MSKNKNRFWIEKQALSHSKIMFNITVHFFSLSKKSIFGLWNCRAIDPNQTERLEGVGGPSMRKSERIACAENQTKVNFCVTDSESVIPHLFSVTNVT